MREKIEVKYAMMTNDFGRKENLPVVRKSDYAKLEERLGEAVELLSEIREAAHCSEKRNGFTNLSCLARRLTEQFLTTLDQEKEKS